ncbi:MFS transporter [Vulcanisaeta sp. EB80]|uniref:MFS transporter n=1 Tax=Vulcanisaeta sp. EB80 TaxID=1650660 RepID=UPI0009BED9A3|nr:MFS transporter [Vulcanisaeta sp. EB80]PLC67528.1 MFS transporter [Vulcanisaeta sp. EB80]
MSSETKLSGIHYVMFLSYSLTFLIWGFVTTSGVMTLDYFSKYIPRFLVPISAAMGPLFLMVGNTLMGRLADIVGRRGIYVFTMSLYTIGLVGMALSLFFINTMPVEIAFTVFLISYILAEIGVGGEEPPALAATTELMPPNRRGSMLVLITNFDNVGAALAALILFLSLLWSTPISATWTMIGTAILIIAVAVVIRLVTPESVRWLMVKGREDVARRIAEEKGLMYAISDYRSKANVRFPPVWFRALVLSLMGFSQLATYGLMAYYIIYLPTLPFSSNEVLAAQVLLWANVGASLAGLVGLVVDNIRRRMFTLLSYIGGLLTMIPIFLVYGLMSTSSIASSLSIFYILLILNMVFSEFGWAVRVLLEPELFPTRVRSTWIGIVRLISWTVYIVLIYYLLATASTFTYLLSNVLLYIVGIAAALAWYIWGVETKGLPVSVLDGAASK